MSQMNISTPTSQYTQGSLVTVTVNTLDQYGHPIPPDNMMTPVAALDYETPNGPVNIFQNKLCVAISTTFYYVNIDSTLLSTGSYNCTLSWYVGGQLMTAVIRFDILAFDGAVLLPIDPISRLRLRLKDHDPDPTRWIWSDQELSEYLNDALDNLNAAPPKGSFFWYNVPLQYMNAIFLYAEYLALNAQAMKIASQGVSYSDRNITVNKPAQAQLYSSLANTVFEKADAERLRIKRQDAYGFSYIVSQSSPYMSQPPLRAVGRYWSL
jgi:hypothetical protein